MTVAAIAGAATIGDIQAAINGGSDFTASGGTAGNLTGGGAEQLNSREATPAPKGLLLPDFGAAFTEFADFGNATGSRPFRMVLQPPGIVECCSPTIRTGREM